MSSQIKFYCAGCQRKLSVRDVHAGKFIRCPNCQTKLQVPAQSELPIADTAPAADAPAAEQPARNAKSQCITLPAVPAVRRAKPALLFVPLAVCATIALACMTGFQFLPSQMQDIPATAPTPAPSIAAPPLAAPAPEAAANAAVTRELVEQENERPAVLPQIGDGTRSADASATATVAADILQQPTAPSAATAANRNVIDDDDVAPEPAPKVAAKTDAGNPAMTGLLDALRNNRNAAPANAGAKGPAALPVAAAANNAPAAAAAPAIAGNPDCAHCLGVGNVPVQPLVRHVRLESELAAPPQNPKAGLPWNPCQKCNVVKLADAGPDPREISRRAYAAHLEWERHAAQKLLYAETRHVSLHSLAPEAFTRAAAEAIDNLTLQLEKTTGSTLLTATQRDTHCILLGWEEKDLPVLEAAARAAKVDFGITKDSDQYASSTRQHGRAYALRFYGGNQPWIPVVTYGQMLMREATDGKAPQWLVEGFASHCESLLYARRSYCCARSGYYAVRNAGSWNAVLKQQCRDIPIAWESVFLLKRPDASVPQALAAWSIVDFMLKTDPKLFCKFVLEIRAGTDSTAAIQKVYNRPLKEMHAIWWQWVKTQK